MHYFVRLIFILKLLCVILFLNNAALLYIKYIVNKIYLSDFFILITFI